MRTEIIPAIDYHKVIQSFRDGDYDYLDRIDREKLIHVENVYNAVIAGGYAYYDSKNDLRYVLHPSAKYDCLQLTCMYLSGENFTMLSDVMIDSLDKLDKQLPDGITLYICIE